MVKVQERWAGKITLEEMKERKIAKKVERK